MKNNLISNKLKKVQALCNNYVRLRDMYLIGTTYKFICISCGRVHELDNEGKSAEYHAGHYWREDKYSSVRFDLDNINSQDRYCNRFLHGNLAEYEQNLRKKIGDQRFEQLAIRRNQTKKYSITELEELEQRFKQGIEQEKIRLKLRDVRK